MQLTILLLLWGLVLVPPLVRRPLVARATAANDPMVAFKGRLARIERTSRHGSNTNRTTVATASLKDSPIARMSALTLPRPSSPAPSLDHLDIVDGDLPFAAPAYEETTSDGITPDNTSDDDDPLLVSFNLLPANPAEAELRRRCVGATLVAVAVLSAAAIPAIGPIAIGIALVAAVTAAVFGYAWWKRNQAPSPFAGLATSIPLPASVTARPIVDAEPHRR